MVDGKLELLTSYRPPLVALFSLLSKEAIVGGYMC